MVLWYVSFMFIVYTRLEVFRTFLCVFYERWPWGFRFPTSTCLGKFTRNKEWAVSLICRDVIVKICKTGLTLNRQKDILWQRVENYGVVSFMFRFEVFGNFLCVFMNVAVGALNLSLTATWVNLPEDKTWTLSRLIYFILFFIIFFLF